MKASSCVSGAIPNNCRDGHHPEQRMDLQWDTAVERERRVARCSLHFTLRSESTGDWPRGCPRSGARLAAEADVVDSRWTPCAVCARRSPANPPRESTCANSLGPARCHRPRRQLHGRVCGRPPADAELLAGPINCRGSGHAYWSARLDGGGPGKRCGVIRTRAVRTPRPSFCCGCAFTSSPRSGRNPRPLLAEDVCAARLSR